jgi:hypothetical protein
MAADDDRAVEEPTYAIDPGGIRRVFGEIPEGWTPEGDTPAEQADEAPKKAPAKK